MRSNGKDSKNVILKCALKEFAEKGYDSASTNKIVERSGFSKGLIFHYYENKLNLFISCLAYSRSVFLELIEEKYNPEEHDILERINNFTNIKADFISTYPELSKLERDAIRIMNEPGFETLHRMMLEQNKYFFDILFDNIDTSYFRDDYEPREIIRFMTNVFNGYLQEYIEIFRDDNECPTLRDLDEKRTRVIDFIRYGICKKE